MRYHVFLATFLGTVFLAVGSVSAENTLFPFVVSFDAPDNVTNISSKLDAPAGKHGLVRIEDGHFVTDAGRIRFWGTNTCFAANFLDKEKADRMADRMARFGINCVRLHHMDMRDLWGSGQIKTQMELDPAQLDKLDYYVAALKKRGIYVNINLHVSRSLDERDGFPKNVNRPSHDKGIDNYYRPFIEANKKFARDLLTHVNPYTGTAYKDEPAVAMVEINNENSIVCMWGGWGGLDVIEDPFLADLRKEWNDWLKAKYKNDAALKKAWNCRNEPLGGEMLHNSNFPKGYVPDGDGWNWETDKKVDAPATNTDGVLRLDVRRKGEVSWHPQLIGSGFSVKKGQLYTLVLKARSDRDTTISLGVRMNHDPWGGLGFDMQARLTAEWQTLTYTFSPNADDGNARLAVGGLEEGMVYEIESVSLKSGGTVGLPVEPVPDPEMLVNGQFNRGYLPDGKGWELERDKQVEASMRNVDGILKIDVRKKGEVDWHPQLLASGFGLEKGKTYVLTLRARADRNTTIHIGARMNHDPWGDLGFSASAPLTKEWQTRTFEFTPNRDDENARLSFGNLTEGTVYEIDAVSLKPKTTPQAPKETSLAGENIPVIWKKNVSSFAKEAVDDFCDFLFDVEAKYWDEMYRYLKDEIKVRQPVSGTQLQYGSTHAQAKMDYCDIHAYWNHPSFPGRPWDGNNWYLRNRTLVNFIDRTCLVSLGANRVAGMPFTVSEYNHPYPNQYAGEGLPLIAAYGAFQDWDGIFPFAYSHSNDPEPQRVTSFFDTCGNTVQMAHMIACHLLFCEDMSSPEDRMLVVPLTAEKEREIFKKDLHQYNFGINGLGYDIRLALTRQVGVDVSGKIAEGSKVDEIPKDQKLFFTDKSADRSRLRFDLTEDQRGFATAHGRAARLFTGFVDEGKEYSLGRYLSLEFGKTNLGWSTVSVAVVGPGKLLLTATGEMLNTDMKLETLDEDKITVGNRWGKPPVRCEGVPVSVAFKDVPFGKLRCWALDESGNRKREVKPLESDVTWAQQRTSKLELKPEYETVWYEIEIEQ